MPRKFWTIANSASVDSDADAQIKLYGPIADDKWWGDEVTAKDFQDDLDALGDVSKIEVRINSGGGSIFAANAITAALKSHKAFIHIIIDGLCASAATIPLSAADLVTVATGGMIMIHDPMYGLLGYYNISEMTKMCDELTKIKNSIIDHYVAKTGKDREVFDELMTNETWLTADEAIELGLVDEKDETNAVNMFMDGKKLISNSLSFDMERFSNFPTAKFAGMKPPNLVSIDNQAPPIKRQNKEDDIVDIKDFQTKHPELYNLVLKEGSQNERNRIKVINELNDMGHPEIKNKAMFDSDDSAGDVAMNILNATKKVEEQHQKDVVDDVQNSGLEEVNPDSEVDEEDTSDTKVNMVVNAINKARGIK